MTEDEIRQTLEIAKVGRQLARISNVVLDTMEARMGHDDVVKTWIEDTRKVIANGESTIIFYANNFSGEDNG